VAPLRPANDAVHLDTTTMDFAEQVRFIVDRARPIFSRR
jgi:cytidylate kinase